jgi:2,3-bisphosphoglycerate-dependent phosphoglycerate mutase
MQQRWPSRIWLVRHGESAGNVAHDAARAARSSTIAIDARRDMDVPLSPLGERQARALGRWVRDLPADERPEVVLASPYLRAHDTARLLCEASGLAAAGVPPLADERLREREFGLIDRLTSRGLQELYPEQAKMRAALGKFYYRPPGGENWCDVLLRLRSVIDSLTREHRERRVAIVCHTVVVMCFRYLLEGLDEAQILAIDRGVRLANCSVTSYRYDPALAAQGRLALERFNFVAPLEEAGEAVTDARDAQVAPR